MQSSFFPFWSHHTMVWGKTDMKYERRKVNEGKTIKKLTIKPDLCFTFCFTQEILNIPKINKISGDCVICQSRRRR